jgi:hypothetical protein
MTERSRNTSAAHDQKKSRAILFDRRDQRSPWSKALPMSNAERTTQLIRALPWGPWPPRVEIAIIEAQARMTGDEADALDIELEMALDTLRDFITCTLDRWQPGGLPN